MVPREIENQLCLAFNSNFSPRKHRREKVGGNDNKLHPEHCKPCPYPSACPLPFLFNLKYSSFKGKKETLKEVWSQLVKNPGEISLLVCGTEYRKSKSVLAEEEMHLLKVSCCSSAQGPLMRACPGMLSTLYLHGKLRFLTPSEI